MKRHCGWQSVGVVMLLCLSTSATPAALTLIYDNGRTQLMAPFLESLQRAESNPEQPPETPLEITEQQRLGPADLNNLLPIRSPGLAPGPLSPDEVKDKLPLLAQGNARPFFLIGSDVLSQRWLTQHRARLEHLGAVGMLVQAQTEADVQRIAELAQGLSITLGAATDIGQALGIRHYPVLISAQGIEQ